MDICFDEENVGVEEKWYETFPARAETAYVPGCWQASFGSFHKNGTVWYQKEFLVSSEHIQLIFEAVNNECNVYIDGRHSMVIRVTNSHNDTDTIPLTYCDWLPYGGIIRSIEVQEYDGTYDVEDSVTALIRTEGPVFTVHGAWAQNIGENEMYVDFMGDKVGIRLRYGADFTVYTPENGALVEYVPDGSSTPHFENEINAFVDCIRSGEKLPSHIEPPCALQSRTSPTSARRSRPLPSGVPTALKSTASISWNL